MAILKCKMCGGNLDLVDDSTVVECEYCGTKQTVPTADNEKKMTLFARANRLRSACEFDKAAGVYESIVAEFPEEAEAYWGLVLCKYGIEYVDDPATGKKIPTCHRSSFDSIMDDSDFEQVMENADAIARRVYREEAKAIEELRKGILEVSSKEEPYDIFICYKETDEDGNRTIDSVIAQDIYDNLTEKGYRVFFARISLEDKLGQEYEPYIFAALNSAKIMLAIGTDYDYYNAVWVKNEWSRFLALISKGEKKTLIPCYKDIDAYDIPKEFKHLQAQDMGKVGAMQDLVRGVEKIIPKAEKDANNNTDNVTVSRNADVENLIKRSFVFLEDSDWDKAEKYAEKALDIDVENAKAYVAKFLSNLKLNKMEEICGLKELAADDPDIKKALKYAKGSFVEQLKNIIEKNRQTVEDFENEETRKRDEKANRIENNKKINKEVDILIEKLENSLNEYEASKKNKKFLKPLITTLSAPEDFDTQIEEKIKSIGNEIDDLENEINSLGVFKKKQKNLLQNKLNELRTERHLLEKKKRKQENYLSQEERNKEIKAENEKLRAENTEIEAENKKNYDKVLSVNDELYQKLKQIESEGCTLICHKLYKAMLNHDYDDLKESLISKQVTASEMKDRIAVAYSHFAFIKEDGTAAAFGTNDDEECNVDKWSDLKSIVAGTRFTVGLQNSGSVTCNGEYRYRDASKWSDIVNVQAEHDWVIGLKSNGKVVGEGDWAKVDVDEWKDIRDIFVGGHSFGIKNDGSVVSTDRKMTETCSGWRDVVSVSADFVAPAGITEWGTVVLPNDTNEVKKNNTRDWYDIIDIANCLYYIIGLKGDGTVVFANTGHLEAFSEAQINNIENWNNIVSIVSVSGLDYAYIIGLKADGTVVKEGKLSYDLSGWKDIIAIRADGKNVIGLKSDGSVECTMKTDE